MMMLLLLLQGRRRAKRKKKWESTEPGPERLELGIQIIESSKDLRAPAAGDRDAPPGAGEGREQGRSVVHAVAS